MIRLDLTQIQKGLEGVDAKIELFDIVSSTSKHLSLQHLGNVFHVCLAEQQTSGEGRLDRKWHSPFGENIYCSCGYTFSKPMAQLSGLSLVVSLAIVKTLSEFGVSELQIKWPNDVIHNNKKLAGSLVELNTQNNISYAIIGMGININMTHENDHDIDQEWTSVKEVTHKESDRNAIVSTLLNNLMCYLNRFNEKGFDVFLNEWSALDFLKDKPITLNAIQQKVEGKVVGINNEGKLLLRLADGQISAFSSGETSVSKT